MRRAVLLAALVLCAGCDRVPQVTFADSAIALPDDPAELPDFPGRDAVIAHCTACHSPSTMLQQPRIPRAKWEGIIGKMAEIYKAPIDPSAVPAIVDYFVAVQGAQTPGSERSR